MIRHALALVLGLAAAAAACAAPPTPANSVVTGSERGTYVQIGRDLAKFVAEPTGVTLSVLPSKGSAENVRRLRAEPGVRLALVQSDVYQAFMDEAEAGSAEAADLIKPLRVILPLYDEEIYFVTRADSPLTYIHEIKDKRINIGPVGSGTALSATTLYRQMFGAPINARNASFLSNEDALLKLATDRSIDVVVVVAGQPAKLFADMTAQARQYIKLLRLDPQAAPSKAAAGTYTASVIRASNYPSWLGDDVPTLTTRAMLVTYNFQTPAARDMLTRFADSLCSNFAQLKAEGHAKWQEVNLSLPPLGKGWNYYAPTVRSIATCNTALNKALPAPPRAATAATAACEQSRQVLGLCR
jgi:TRAP transporter TAXI family solute receptor